MTIHYIETHLQKGFSFIELMIALLLGLILFTAVGHLVLGASRSWAMQDELSRIQESARLALDLLGQNISTAAYTGCPSQASIANMLDAADDDRQWMAHFDKGILGLSAGAAVTQQLDSNAISDAIIIHRLDSDSTELVSGHNVSNATLSLSNRHSYDEGDLLALISPDCGQ
ncbi:MAG: PilW family protein, partial [Endozoicomonas sp.]